MTCEKCKIKECVLICRSCCHPFDLDERYYDFTNHGKFHKNCIPSYLKTFITSGIAGDKK